MCLVQLNAGECLGCEKDLENTFLRTNTSLKLRGSENPAWANPTLPPEFIRRFSVEMTRYLNLLNLKLKDKTKKKADQLEENSGLAPSRYVDKADDSWRPHLYLCDPQGVIILKPGELSSVNEVIVSKESHRFV